MTIITPPGRTLGVDVSVYQGVVPWRALRDVGVRFMLARSGFGTSLDKTFSTNVEGAINADILDGSYHFFSPPVDAVTQARLYYQNAHVTMMGPCMDFESLYGVTPKLAVQRAETFVLESEQLWGKPCTVYTYPSLWVDELRGIESETLGSRPLHIAHYGTKNPIVPAPWKTKGWTYHQFDGSGGERMPDGRDCDFNWYAGDYNDLVAYLQGAPFAQTQQTPDPLPTFASWAASLNLVDMTRQTSDEDIAARERRVSEEEDRLARRRREMDPNNAAYEHQLKVARLRVRYWKAMFDSRSDASPQYADAAMARAESVKAELSSMDEEL